MLLILALVIIASIDFSSAIIIDAATIQGTVRGTDGTPIAGALVEVKGLPGTNATTGPDGFYSLDVPTNSTGFTLRFTAVDKAPVERPTGPIAPLAVLVVNATLPNLPPTALLHITNLPAYIPGSYGLREDYVTVTNASGTGSFYNRQRVWQVDVSVPAPGTYLVMGSRPGYYNRTVEVTVRRGDDLAVQVDLTDFKKPFYGVIWGKVTHDGAALPNATVTAAPDDGSRVFDARTDATGGYSLEVPPGNYSVRAEAEGYARITRAARVVAGGTYDVDIALPVAEETGGLGGSALAWAVLVAAVVALGAVAVVAAVVQRRARRAREAEATAEATLECPECGAAAPQDADACPACGARFPWRSFRCPECGSPLALDAKRCPDCGNTRFDLHRG